MKFFNLEYLFIMVFFTICSQF